MAEEEKSNEQPAEAGENQQAGGGQKIMCFVSKEMVPINQTVELEYAAGKKVRVMPKYVKYDLEESAL
jgi:hypothetical protein